MSNWPTLESKGVSSKLPSGPVADRWVTYKEDVKLVNPNKIGRAHV